MRPKSIIKKSRKLSRPFRVSKGETFRLEDVDPEDTPGSGPDEKTRARRVLAWASRRSRSSRTCSTPRIDERCSRSFQAMDAAGKDGTIDALGSLDLDYPETGPARLKELAQARRALLGEK
jgi:polyphosphate kinase 2 (PPK2 family)